MVSSLIMMTGSFSWAQRFRMEDAGISDIKVNFDALKVNNQIQFSWNVNMEDNIRSYEIIRGTQNGRYLDWQVLSRQTVDKSKSGSYTFSDDAPILGEMHYRLKLVAPDGSSVEYSPLFKVPEKIIHIAKN